MRKIISLPDLASEVPSTTNGDISADGLTITLKLKPNLKWSDGQPITSKDILYTWQMNVDPKNAVLSRGGWSQITGIDTPDDQTAVVHFQCPLSALGYALRGRSQTTGSPLLPQHLLQGKKAWRKIRIAFATVFSGPFMVKEWVAGDHMTLVPNPNYWQGAPKLSQINIKFVPDPETALAALKSGDADFVPDLAASDLPTLKQMNSDTSGKVVSRSDGSGDFEHLFFDLGTTAGQQENGQTVGQSDVNGFCPFQDPNVRKAMALGMDRDTYIKTLLFGGAQNIATLWPNSIWNDSSLTPYPFDPTTAASLLDTAGYKVGSDGIRAGTCDGKPVKFDNVGLETTTKQLREDYGGAIQADLAKLGITVKTNFLPAGTFFGSYSAGADMPTGKFDMAIYTTGFYPDPYSDNFLCTSVPDKANQSGDNNYHYCDPAFDALWAQANASLDTTARQTAMTAIQNYMYNNYLVVPLYARPNVYGLSSRFVPGPGGNNGGFNWNCLTGMSLNKS